jgi:hypothetical protein
VNKQDNMALHVTQDLWSTPTHHDIFNVVIVPPSWNSDEETFKIG